MDDNLDFGEADLQSGFMIADIPMRDTFRLALPFLFRAEFNTTRNILGTAETVYAGARDFYRMKVSERVEMSLVAERRWWGCLTTRYLQNVLDIPSQLITRALTASRLAANPTIIPTITSTLNTRS
jgi:hypothetical protein